MVEDMVKIDANGQSLLRSYWAYFRLPWKAKKIIWDNLFSCLSVQLLLSYRHLDHSEEKNESKSKCLLLFGPKTFEQNILVESIANPGISVWMSKQSKVTRHKKESAVQKKRVRMGNWFWTPGSMSPKLPFLVLVPPRLSTHCDSPSSIESPLLERASILSIACSSPAQCLLWSGISNPFPSF